MLWFDRSSQGGFLLSASVDLARRTVLSLRCDLH